MKYAFFSIVCICLAACFIAKTYERIQARRAMTALQYVQMAVRQ